MCDPDICDECRACNPVDTAPSRLFGKVKSELLTVTLSNGR